MTTTEILSLEELTRYLKVSKQVVYKLVQRGKIPSFKLGKRLRFRKSKIDAWIDKREQERSKKARKRNSFHASH